MFTANVDAASCRVTCQKTSAIYTRLKRQDAASTLRAETDKSYTSHSRTASRSDFIGSRVGVNSWPT